MNVASLFDSLRAAQSVSSKVEAAKRLGDLLQEAVRAAGLEDARTRSLLADVVKRTLALSRDEDAGCREAAATILAVSTRVCVASVAPGGGGEQSLAALLTHSAAVEAAGSAGLLSFTTFSIQSVLTVGLPLLAHSEHRYDEALGCAGVGGPTTVLLLQRKEALRVIGLGAAGVAASALAITDFGSLVSSEDFAGVAPIGRKRGRARAAPSALLPAPTAARADHELGSDGDSGPPTCLSTLADAYSALCFAAFHPDWAIRHGAASGLEHMLHGLTLAQQRVGSASTPRAGSNGGGPGADAYGHPLVQDAVLRCVALLALDRVGDYTGRVGDAAGADEDRQGADSGSTKAPVREAAARVLAAAVRSLSGAGVTRLARYLDALAASDEWNTRHGAALALQALLPSLDATGMLEPALASVGPLLARLLKDATRSAGGSEDVSAVAAGCALYLFKLAEAQPARARAVCDALPVQALCKDCTRLLCSADDPSSPLAGTVLPLAVSALALLSTADGRKGKARGKAAGLDDGGHKLAVASASFVRHPSLVVRCAALRALTTLCGRAQGEDVLPMALLAIAAAFRGAMAEPELQDAGSVTTATLLASVTEPHGEWAAATLEGGALDQRSGACLSTVESLAVALFESSVAAVARGRGGAHGLASWFRAAAAVLRLADGEVLCGPAVEPECTLLVSDGDGEGEAEGAGARGSSAGETTPMTTRKRALGARLLAAALGALTPPHSCAAHVRDLMRAGSDAGESSTVQCASLLTLCLSRTAVRSLEVGFAATHAALDRFPPALPSSASVSANVVEMRSHLRLLHAACSDLRAALDASGFAVPPMEQQPGAGAPVTSAAAAPAGGQRSRRRVEAAPAPELLVTDLSGTVAWAQLLEAVAAGHPKPGSKSNTYPGKGEVELQLSCTVAARDACSAAWASLARLTAGLGAAARLLPAAAARDVSLLPERLTPCLRALLELACPSASGAAPPVSSQAIACACVAAFLAFCLGGEAPAGQGAGLDLPKIGKRVLDNILTHSRVEEESPARRGAVLVLHALTRSPRGVPPPGFNQTGPLLAAEIAAEPDKSCILIAACFGGALFPRLAPELPALLRALVSQRGDAPASALTAALCHSISRTTSTLVPVMGRLRACLPGASLALAEGGEQVSGDGAKRTLLRALSLLLTDAARMVAIGGSTPGADRVPLSAALPAYAPLFLPFILSCIGHACPTVRASATDAFRCCVASLPISAAPADSTTALTAGWDAETRAAAAAGLAVVSTLREGARSGLARLPLSIADTLEPASASGCSPPAASSSAVALASERQELALRLPPSISLRPYQAEGVAWLVFLRSHGLGGILADDMGLGKTLQALCAVALFAASVQGAGAGSGRVQPVSVVAAPTTLLHHWRAEAERFYGGTLRPVVVEGTAGERSATLAAALAPSAPGLHTLLLLPHSLFRREGEVTSLAAALAGRLGYFILDEAHLACNPASALAKGVKSLAGVAGHRLALTGTPVQNGVHELWTAFDWLVPGYLGEEGGFRKGTTAVIARARGANASAEDVRAARVVLRSLHRSLLPFILRRLKCDVLTDLPPRTIVDILVELAPAQRALYDAFTAKVGTAWAHAAVRSVEGEEGEEEGAGAAAPAAAPPAREEGQPSVNTLSAITTLRQICGHPRLVTDGTLRGAVAARSERDDAFPMHESCKLIGLLQLLQQLGVASSAVEEGEEGERAGPKPRRQRKEGGGGAGGGASEEGEEAAEAGPAVLTPSLSVDARKVLVFSQSTRMLDAVAHMLGSTPGISRVGFCRMDGSTPGPSRPALAASFNNNPSMRLLLLTTGVGGLGLSLVGADTVVFLDHDWNPSRDLQAMDRAHRIGQTRSVTVYRLLAKGTLEERIMGVQRFKTGVAGVVVGGGGAGGSSVLEGAWGGAGAGRRQDEVGGAEVEEDAAAFFAARRTGNRSGGGKRKRGDEQ